MQRLLLNASRLPCLSCPGLPMLPVRQSLHVLRGFCASSASGLVSVGACCCGAFRPLPRSSWSLRAPSLCTSVLDLALLPGTLVTIARSHSFAPFRACAGRTLHVSSAASGRCSRISPSRSLVEGLVCVPPSPVRRRLLARLLRSFSTWFRRVSGVAGASPRLLQAPLLFWRLPRAWHRLSVTFEMLGLCCVLLVRDLLLRTVDGELDVELGTIRVPLEMSSQQPLVYELSL